MGKKSREIVELDLKGLIMGARFTKKYKIK